jgi:aminopeptidase N
MQAYLVAFVISNSGMVSNAATKQPDELLQSVYGQPDRIAQGDAAVALVMGQRIMKVLEQHLGMKYSLPKMDQIAVPNFYWNAMENFGLVT